MKGYNVIQNKIEQLFKIRTFYNFHFNYLETFQSISTQVSPSFTIFLSPNWVTFARICTRDARHLTIGTIKYIKLKLEMPIWII